MEYTPFNKQANKLTLKNSFQLLFLQQTCKKLDYKTLHSYLMLSSGLVLCIWTSQIGQILLTSTYLTMQDLQTVKELQKQ
jgi:hypothetical protein